MTTTTKKTYAHMYVDKPSEYQKGCIKRTEYLLVEIDTDDIENDEEYHNHLFYFYKNYIGGGFIRTNVDVLSGKTSPYYKKEGTIDYYESEESLYLDYDYGVYYMVSTPDGKDVENVYIKPFYSETITIS
jgi:hypothetical protein